MQDSSVGEPKPEQVKRPADSGARVQCFVCKRDVDPKTVQQLKHPKQNLVWVCEVHIK